MAPFVPDVVGDEVGGVVIDPIFHGVLLTYVDEHRDTFGGLWIDREAGGTVVLAFTDDAAAHRAAVAARAPATTDVHAVEPPPPIVDERPIGEWDVAFDVVQVPRTEAELNAMVPVVTERLRSAGLAVDGGGLHAMRNRVFVSVPRTITPGDLDVMTAALAPSIPLEAVCVEASVVEVVPQPVQPGTALDVIELPDEDGTYPPDTFVECRGARFQLGALSSPTPLVSVDPGLRAVLDAWLTGPEGAYLPHDGWFLLEERDDTATFAHIDTDGASFIDAERGRDGWIWASAHSGGNCDVQAVLPTGLGPVDWLLDPSFPTPDTASTELHLLVTERACTSGSAPQERLLGPQIVETDTAVRIAFATIAVTGSQTCPDNPATPVTITLQRPLAGREIRNGLTIAPITDLAPH